MVNSLTGKRGQSTRLCADARKRGIAVHIMKHKRLNRDGWGFQYYPYYQMLEECNRIVKELCSDIPATHAWCSEIRESAERRIAAGEPVKKGREILQMENHAK